MLTDKDFDKLMRIFPTRDDFTRLEERISTVEESQQRIVSGIDNLATAIDTQTLSNAARDAQLSRHDQWIHKIGEKTGVELKG